MPQKHDQGWKKQQSSSSAEPPINPDRLARELVENGRASPQILDLRFSFSRSRESNA